jgi:hypothetical protein
MSVIDLRLYNALQKLKGFTKTAQEAEKKLLPVKQQAATIAEAMRNARQPLVKYLKSTPKSRAHLKVIK